MENVDMIRSKATKIAFDRLFPNVAVRQWWRKSANSIRVRQKKGPDLFFTYESETKWKLETEEIFVLSKDGI